MGIGILGDWGALSQGRLCRQTLASEPDWTLFVQLAAAGGGLTLSVLQLPVCK